ncbi:hypothetical protein ACLTEW_24290 [Gordonia lacunae]|uniref:hypothetical protein n=1 Tax=Gordonia TaxID=2053 RepID=UPI00200A7DE2|nr:hypothetical protein [Gordonia terrae]UPW11988.1 hypothetical protein M1C59_25880 [Gordonia terrae]
MTDVRWEQSLDPRWTRAVYDAIADDEMKMIVRKDDAVTVTVSGTCPNCGHEFTDTDTLRGAADTGGGTLGETRDSLRTDFVTPHTTRQLPPATLRCTCAEEHRGRPGEARGCGIYFTLTVAER